LGGRKGGGELSCIRDLGYGSRARRAATSAATTLATDGGVAARRVAISHGFDRFVGTINADALAAASLSLAFYTLPHLLGDAEALTAASLVARAGIGTG